MLTYKMAGNLNPSGYITAIVAASVLYSLYSETRNAQHYYPYGPHHPMLFNYSALMVFLNNLLIVMISAVVAVNKGQNFQWFGWVLGQKDDLLKAALLAVRQLTVWAIGFRYGFALQLLLEASAICTKPVTDLLIFKRNLTVERSFIAVAYLVGLFLYVYAHVGFHSAIANSLIVLTLACESFVYKLNETGNLGVTGHEYVYLTASSAVSALIALVFGFLFGDLQTAMHTASAEPVLACVFACVFSACAMCLFVEFTLLFDWNLGARVNSAAHLAQILLSWRFFNSAIERKAIYGGGLVVLSLGFDLLLAWLDRDSLTLFKAAPSQGDETEYPRFRPEQNYYEVTRRQSY